MLFDWLVVGQVLAVNPAAAVRGPKYVVRTGKTPVLGALEARQLLDSIDTSTVMGLRDRALIGLLVFTFVRIGRGARHDRGRRLLAAPAAMGPSSRERRQGTRYVLPPQSRDLPCRITSRPQVSPAIARVRFSAPAIGAPAF
jgi:integrase